MPRNRAKIVFLTDIFLLLDDIFFGRAGLTRKPLLLYTCDLFAIFMYAEKDDVIDFVLSQLNTQKS